jgi:hypothetical protein
MERIGVVLRRLKLDPENLAVRGHDGAHKFGGDGLPSQGGETGNPSPVTLNRGVSPERNARIKRTGRETPRQLDQWAGRTSERPSLVLVSTKDMGRANPTRMPRAARPISLRLVHDAFRSITL